MTTISASSTIGIQLSSPSYTNPVVIDPGVTIHGAHLGVFAPTGSWTIQNDGSIGGAATYTVGVYMQDGVGIVVNDGIISGGTGSSGGGAGVILELGGSVTNAAVASITGGDGIEIGGVEGHVHSSAAGPGTVVNNGSIAGYSRDGFYGIGVYLGSGGSVTNATSGSITGGFGNGTIFGGGGVVVDGGAGTVVNGGVIAGIGTTGSGINLTGLVINAASGSITGGTGVLDTSGTIINLGSIAGTGTDGQGVWLIDGGLVTNAASASITGGGEAIDIEGGTGTVINYGYIAGFLFDGVAMGASGSTLTNAASGLITGATAVYGNNGTVINQGSIAGTGSLGNGVLLHNGGFVTNAASASITGANEGIQISGGAGTLINSGRIAGTGTNGQGVALLSGGSVTNTAAASITGGYAGIDAHAGIATVVNDGTITAFGEHGTDIYLGAGGVVINQVGATIGSPSANTSAVYISGGVGTVTNFGTMNAAVWFQTGGAVTNESGGRIISGSTSGYGVGLYSGGTVTNAGEISGLLVGIDASHLGGTVINQAGGTITGQYAGVLMGIIDNPSGGSRNVTNQAGGTIIGDSGVLAGGNSATVTNAGTIAGTFAGTISHGGITLVVGAGVSMTAGGIVTNQSGGIITGASYGVYISNGAAMVVNAGTISGSSGAVRFAAGDEDRLVVDPGAVFNGTVNGGNTLGATALSALELATGASTGTLSGLGTKYVDFGTIIFDLNSDWLIAGNTSGLTSTIVGFAQGDTIELTGVTATGSSFANGILTLDEASGAAKLNFAGTFASDAFQIANVSGGVEVTTSATVSSGVYDSNSLTNSGLVESVTLGAGAVLTNAATGLITNPSGTGVYSAATSTGVSVINAGGIAGGGANGFGIELLGGGVVTNAATGTIASSQHNGVYITGAAGTVINAGIISSAGTHAPISLFKGGAVSNAGTGTISSSIWTGIYITGAAGTVLNAGHITSGGTHIAVDLTKGGYVSNAATGVISNSSGGGAIYVKGGATVVNFGTLAGKSGVDDTGAITVINAGTISASSSGGVNINGAAGGAVTNQSTGTISVNGGGADVYVNGGVGTVLNAGKLSAQATAILFKNGGSVTNQSTGTISGDTGQGVFVNGGAGTVINAGTISGTTYAVRFAAGFTNRLVVDPGAVFTGTVTGGNVIGGTAVSTLELASGTSTGTLTGLGSKYSDFAQITIDPGATWTLAGVNTLVAGQTLTLTGATLTDPTNLVNDGGIIIDPSTMTVAGLIGTGSVTIDAASTLGVQGTVANGETIVFSGSGAYLYLANPDAVAGSVTNFAVGDTIDLKGITSADYSGGMLSFNGGSFALSLANGSTATASISGDNVVISASLCFCANTQILTPLGERSVQELAVGDLVTTWSGETRHIVWIGVGKVLATRGRRNAATPVIVRKGALADNVPNRDLRVTKGHAFYLDDVLIPVEFLVNHRSILWDDRAQEVELYHMELESHDVLLANGAPAETYRDDGNRWLFQNANSGWGLPPQEPCAPVLTGGPVVDAVWRRLLDRAGLRPGLPTTADPDLHLLVDGRRVDGKTQAGGLYMFHLLERPGNVRIISRAGAPDALGIARDPRLLGVGVRQIRLWRGARLRLIEASDPSLDEGFQLFEADNGIRWTDGNALLPAALFEGVDGACELELYVGGATQYPLFGEPVRAEAA